MRIPLVKAYSIGLVCFLAGITIPASGSEARLDYWIGTNANGHFVGSVGTLDGSTYSNFDFNLASLPPQATIHLLPGIYQTHGSRAWGPKTGQRIIGAGMDATVLQVPAAYTASGALNRMFVIEPASPYFQSNILVSDLTIDCNYQVGTIVTLDGINLCGSGNTIERVKLINAAAFSSSRSNYTEAWGLIIASYPFGIGSGNLIRDCVISNFTCNYNNNLSALGLLENESGIVCDNLIVQQGTHKVFGLYVGSHDSVIQGNRLIGVRLGSHTDTGTPIKGVSIVNNQFIDCAAAIDWNNGICANDTFASNNIVLSNYVAGANVAAFRFGGKPAAYTNLLFLCNTVSVARANVPAPGPMFIWGSKITGISARYNTLAASLTNCLIDCPNAAFENNSIQMQP